MKTGVEVGYCHVHGVGVGYCLVAGGGVGNCHVDGGGGWILPCRRGWGLDTAM